MKDGTKRTLEGIDNLLAEKQRVGSRVSIIVKPAIMAQNYCGLPALVRHFGTSSKIQIHFQPYVGTIDKPFWIKDINELQGVLNELRELRREHYPIILSDRQPEGFLEHFTSLPVDGNIRHLDLGGHKRNCDIGLRSMFVFANGDVHFCDYLGRPIGNIHQQSLSDIYYGGPAGSQRKTMIYCNIDCQQTCKRPVPLWVKARAFLRMG